MADNTKTVLIVDDSAVARLLIRKLLSAKRPEWRLLEAANSDEALRLAQAEQPDLITIDINMPGMNGLDLAVKIRESCPSSRLAIVTANIQDSTRKRIQELGILFVGVIDKPVTEASIEKLLYFL